MNCPTCQIAVTEGAAICDNCNAILDASFLGDDITNESTADATRIKAAPPPADQATRVKAAPAPPAKAKKAAAPAKPLYEEDGDESTQSGRPKASLDEVAAVPSDTIEAVDDLVAQFKSSPLGERVSLVGAALFLFALALPWKATKDEGDLIGLLAGGAPIALLVLVVIAAVVLRRHPKVRPFRDRVLQASVAASFFAGLATVAYQQSTLVQVVVTVGARRERRDVVWPMFGVYIGIAAALVMIVGTVKTWMDRESLHD